MRQLSIVVRFRLSRIARVTSFLMLLCLGFMSAETLIADTCDGDSRASSSVAVVDADHGPSDSGELPTPEGKHSTHVDHCVHPHAGAPISRFATPAAPALHLGQVRAESEREPESATLEPHFRPPVG